jgi:CheY-like chemotaxis protein
MPTRSPELGAPSILVTDDDPHVRTLCRRILEATGCTATEARNGTEALHAIGDAFFEIMLMDLSMPDTDGFELLRAVRAEVPQLKIIVMSGFMCGTLLSAARLSGAAAILTKPFEPRVLRYIVDNLLAAA